MSNIKHTLQKEYQTLSPDTSPSRSPIDAQPPTTDRKKSNNLEMVSKLCLLLVENYDEKERLRHQLQTLEGHRPKPFLQLEGELKRKPEYALVAEERKFSVLVQK